MVRGAVVLLPARTVVHAAVLARDSLRADSHSHGGFATWGLDSICAHDHHQLILEETDRAELAAGGKWEWEWEWNALSKE